MNRLPALALCLFLFGTTGALLAQERDTVWRVDFARWIEDRSGRPFLKDTTTLHFDDEVAARVIDEQRAMVIRQDTIYVIDHAARTVSIGPHQFVNMSWITNPELVWKQRRYGGVVFEATGETEKIASYPGHEQTLDFRSNGRMLPMTRHLILTDEVPVSRAALENFYLLFALFDVDLSVDLPMASDTLVDAGLLALQIRTGTYLPGDTSGITVMRAISVKREPVSTALFAWPAGYTEMRFRVPNESEFWELTGVPMPGGEKNAE